MKASRHKKALGLAIGDRSIFVAEVAEGVVPQAMRLAEFIFPASLSLAQPAELGAALDRFLKESGFTTRQAVAGIPARWLAVKSKDVPPADDATLAELLRLQAEADFSTELKDLVYDYASSANSGKARSVLLMALPRKHIETLHLLCDAAHLHLLAIAPSALVLSDATGQSSQRGGMVLATSPSGAELTLHRDSATSAVRHLRPPQPEPAFYSDVRRAIATLSNGSSAGKEELILWDSAGVDREILGKNLGLNVRAGDMASLGVNAAPASSNGETRKYGPAVALGLAGIGGAKLSVDFLASRLAAPKKSRLPRWTVAAALGAIVVILLAYLAYSQLQNRQDEADRLQAQLDGMKSGVESAQAFVDKVIFAQTWNGGDPRYVACLHDLTVVMPEDRFTYATNLHLWETPRPNRTADNSAATQPTERPTLSGKIEGETETSEGAQKFVTALLALPQFRDVNLENSTDNAHTHSVTFAISFTYVPDTK